MTCFGKKARQGMQTWKEMTRNQRQSGSEGASHDYTSTSMVQCAGRESEDHGRIKDVQQDQKRQLTEQELRDLIWEKARQGMKTWQKNPQRA